MSESNIVCFFHRQHTWKRTQREREGERERKREMSGITGLDSTCNTLFVAWLILRIQWMIGQKIRYIRVPDIKKHRL